MSSVLPFFAGPENRLAEVVVRTVLDETATPYNPLVVAGPSGVGKSHLVRGLAAAYQARHPRRPVVCRAAVDFARELADAMDSLGLDAFRRRYRSARLLLVEDVTRLAQRDAAQRELLHTLDAAIESGHHVLVTADSPPGHWPRILPSLQSRFEAGLCVRLASPGLEARLAILRDLAARRGLPLAEPAARLLAARPRSDVRELIGALVELHARHSRDDRPLDLDSVRTHLASQRGWPAVALGDIAAATARAFSLSLGQLRSRSRRRETVAARGVAMHLARRLTPLSLEQIGHYFGGRDHTTVLHSCRKTEILLRDEPATQEMIQRVEETLQTKITANRRNTELVAVSS
ncbi:MAG: ATP-binding protein [Pirellulaceae bacterium]|nr:ATP-binding protein [Pirellulaceae bacterium]